MHREQTDRRLWGRLFESAVGCHILNESFTHRVCPFYWRDGNDEVDFVLQYGGKVVGLEVKSNLEKYNIGLSTFRDRFNPHTAFVVGYEGYPIEEFLSADLRLLFK